MLNLDDIIELRKIIKDKYNQTMHVHDTCGGQYFDFNEKIDGIQDVVNDYLSKLNQKAEFASDGLSFTVE